MNLLEVCNLRKTFGNLVAVEDVSFSVAPGEVFGLLGPNGAGKSTTMNMIVGLLAPDSGAIRLEARELSPENRDLRQALGVGAARFGDLPRFVGAGEPRLFRPPLRHQGADSQTTNQ